MSFSEVPPLNVGGGAAASDVKRLKAEMEDLLRERRQAELKLRDLDAKRVPGPGGRGGGAIGPGGGLRGGEGLRGHDRDGGGVFDRGGRAIMGGRLEGRLGVGDLRGELRRGVGDMRRPGGEIGHRSEMDRDGRGDSERPKAPHPWDPTPKREPMRPLQAPKSLIQSAITKRGREGEDEGPEDEDEEQRRKKRGRDDDEEEGEEDGKDAVEEEKYSGMRMDDASADFERSAKSRRISSEGDRDRETDKRRESDRDREGARDRQLRSPRDQRPAGKADNKERSEGAPGLDKTEVKNRNKRMFGGLLGHLQKAKKEEETISHSDTVKRRQELQEAAEKKAAEMSAKIREQSRAEQQAAREQARDERRKNITRIREIRTKQMEMLHQLALARGNTQAQLLSNYIRTKTKPHIFWQPKREKTGIKTVTHPAVEPLHHDTRKCLEEELAMTSARLEQQRAEDVAAEAARQAAFEAERVERLKRAAESAGKHGNDEEGGKGETAVGEGEEEDEEEEEAGEEIVL